MQKLTLPLELKVTKEKIAEILGKKFTNYEVGLSKLVGADVYVKKSGSVGVILRIKQKDNGYFFKIYGYAPSFLFRMFLYGLIPILIVMPKWKKLEKEIADYMNTDEFKQQLAG